MFPANSVYLREDGEDFDLSPGVRGLCVVVATLPSLRVAAFRLIQDGSNMTGTICV